MKKLKNFTIHEPVRNIYHFSFKDRFKCGAMFFRYQEFYESPLKNIKNKNVTFFQLFEIYSKKFGEGAWQYANHWVGFNIPSWVFDKVFSTITNIDFNEYDSQMKEAYEYCLKKSKGKPFYIIGSSGNKKTFNHEVAHGLYYINEDYKKQMDELVSKLPKKTRLKLFKILKENQYCDEVLVDEVQAYLSTGLMFGMEFVKDKIVTDEFKKVFLKFFKKNKLASK